MIQRRLILSAIVLAGLVVSAGVVVVGLIYALYALLEPALGRAGATGALVAVVAVLLGVAAAVLFRLSRSKTETVVVVASPAPSPVAGLMDALSDTMRDRPVVVLLAAVGAGVLVVRNPVYLASAIRAFAGPKIVET